MKNVFVLQVLIRVVEHSNKPMKKLTHHICTFIFIVASCLLEAQHTKIDSLQKLLNTAQTDTSQLKTLNVLVSEYINTGNYEQARKYAEQALQQAEKLKHKKGLATAFISIGNINMYQGNYEQALDNYSRSLAIQEEIGDQKGMATSYGNIGIIHQHQGSYQKALENYLKALNIREIINDKKGIAASYHQIAGIYLQMGNYDKSLEKYYESLKIREEIGDKRGIAASYNNIGNNYDLMGDYEKALENHLKSLKIREETGDKKGLGDSYANLGVIYDKQNKNEKALNSYIKALDINKEIGYKYGIAASYLNIGSIHMKVGKLEEANQYLSRPLALFKEIGDKEGIKETYALLSDLFEKKEDYKQSLTYHKLFSGTQDSLLKEKSSKQIADLTARYETEKKDKEILIKEKELQDQGLKISRMSIYILILLILVMCISFIGYIIVRKNKHEALYQTIKLEQKLLQSQMSPHFIFNSLSAIQNFIFQNKNEAAVEYLARLAKLVRMILENSRQEYVTLDKETNMLELYMELQSARFKNRFNYTIDIDPELSPDMIAIPPMLAQPFIENSIEHGIMHKEGIGNIKIVFKEESDMLLFEVTDDGVGREKAKEISAQSSIKKKHVSLATKITEERLENINKSLNRKNKIKLNIIDLKDENGNASGTTVKFYIPFKEV